MATNETKIVITAQDRATQALASATRSIDQFKSAASTLPGIGTLLAGVSFGGIAAMARSTIDAADSFNDLSERIGINVRQLAQWEFAARRGDTTIESVGRGVKALSTYMVANGEALKNSGITATNANDALVQLADLFSAMPDGIEKTALATQIFGKAGLDLLPMLNLGSEGLDELRKKSDAYADAMEKLAPKAGQFNDGLDELALASKTAGVNIGNYLIGPLASVADFGTKAVIGIEQLGSSLAVIANDIVVFGQVSAAALAGGFTEEGQAYIKQKLDERRRFVEAANEDMVRRLSNVESLRDKVDAAMNGGTAAGPAKTGTDRGLLNRKGEKPEKSATAKAGKTDLQKMIELGEKNLAESQLKYIDSEEVMREVAEKRAIESAKNLQKEAEEVERLTQKRKELADTYDLQQAKASNAYAGATDAIKKYSESVSNVAAFTESAFTRAFQGMEDSLVTFVKTGKLDFKSLADSIISDMIRMQVQQNIMKPLAAMGNDFLSSIFKGGVGDVVGQSLGVPRYAQGTPWVPNDGLAYLHKGEAVVPAAVNNAAMGGSSAPSVSIQQHIYPSPGVSSGDLMQAMVAAKNAAISEIHNSMRRGGSFA